MSLGFCQLLTLMLFDSVLVREFTLRLLCIIVELAPFSFCVTPLYSWWFSFLWNCLWNWYRYSSLCGAQGVFINMCTCTCQDQKLTLECLSWLFSTNFLRQSLTPNIEFTNWLGCMQASDSICLHTLHFWGDRPYPAFACILGIWTWALVLVWQDFTPYHLRDLQLYFNCVRVI